MRFLTGKVKARTGEKITVTTSSITRVLIMQEKHYKRYKNHQTFTYYGGEKSEPYEFMVPVSGIWMVVVEKGPYHAPIEMSASILKTVAEPRQRVLPNPELVEDKKGKKEKKKKKGKKGAEEEIELAPEMETDIAVDEPIADESSEETKED